MYAIILTAALMGADPAVENLPAPVIVQECQAAHHHYYFGWYDGPVRHLLFHQKPVRGFFHNRRPVRRILTRVFNGCR